MPELTGLWLHLKGGMPTKIVSNYLGKVHASC